MPRWINTAAAVVTTFFVCFGFSQLSVLLHGWQWLAAAGRSRDEPSNGDGPS